jgi:hypothetical protein
VVPVFAVLVERVATDRELGQADVAASAAHLHERQRRVAQVNRARGVGRLAQGAVGHHDDLAARHAPQHVAGEAQRARVVGARVGRVHRVELSLEGRRIPGHGPERRDHRVHLRHEHAIGPAQSTDDLLHLVARDGQAAG